MLGHGNLLLLRGTAAAIHTLDPAAVQVCGAPGGARAPIRFAVFDRRSQSR